MGGLCPTRRRGAGALEVTSSAAPPPRLYPHGDPWRGAANPFDEGALRRRRLGRCNRCGPSAHSLARGEHFVFDGFSPSETLLR